MVAKPHIYKTEGLANLEKNPPELADASQYGGRVRCATCVWNFTTATLATNDRFMGCSLPSWAVPLSIRLKWEDMGSGVQSFDVGLYSPGAPLEDTILPPAQCFATDINMNPSPEYADETDAEVLLEASTINPKFGQPLWSWAANTSDPQVDYWVGLCCTNNGTPTVGGTKTIVMTVLYVLD